MDINKLNSDTNNVYQLTGKINQIYELVKEADGVIEEDTLKALEINKQEVLNIGKDIFSLNNVITGQVDMIDKEIKRLTDLKAWREKQQENIQKTLLYLLLNFGEQDKKGIWRLDLGVVLLSSKKNPESVEITNEAEVPNDFKKFDFTVKDLSYDELEQLKKLFNCEPVEVDLDFLSKLGSDNIKETQKISKTDLKPKVKENKERLEELAEKLSNELITEEEFNLEKEALPNYGARIKEGDLKLVIK